ncbi:hypothetical protein [Candidatus Pantoea deserta]|uniref:hypothetical protein n=1 Tax=Candidatus Pantoea deserta TaxID=1869313 RepID=UPI000F501DD7|nr:hypothetical protein [Pantoea deserta]
MHGHTGQRRHDKRAYACRHKHGRKVSPAPKASFFPRHQLRVQQQGHRHHGRASFHLPDARRFGFRQAVRS